MSHVVQSEMRAQISPTAWWNGAVKAWDQFWFTPTKAHTLCLLRVLGGAMLLYSHIVWGLNLSSFLGNHAWVTADVNRQLLGAEAAFAPTTLLSDVLLGMEQTPYFAAIHWSLALVLGAFVVGWQTRITAPLAALICLAYCQRLTAALYGLDQALALLTMYLAIAPCGKHYSVDAWLANRANVALPQPREFVLCTIATRLMQLHLCAIYLFGGIGKARGELWWDGSALWFAFANAEYRSLDMTWLVKSPFVIAGLTHLTLFWETFYPVLIWPRLTRPVFLLLAIAMHLGIALSLGMITFGLAMIFANLSFVAPGQIESWSTWITSRWLGSTVHAVAAK